MWKSKFPVPQITVMKSISHSLTGIIATSLLITSNPLYLAVASMVSLLPDCDTSTSTLGRIPPFSFIAKYIEQRYPHRSITHSFLITGIITLVTAPIALINPILWQTISLSYFVGWFGDVFTKSGVCAFYPSQARLVIPGNPRLRLSTNSSAEYWLIGFFTIILILSLYISNLGSITNTFNTILKLPSGAIEQIKQDISEYVLYAQIQGYNSITQERINDKFEVVELITANDFLGKDLEGNLYRIGNSQESNIIVSKMIIKKGKPSEQIIKEITIEDDDIIDYINYEDNGRTYVTGNLIIEDGEDLILPKRADIYNPITLQPSNDDRVFIKINSAPLNYCKQYLTDYSGTGTIIIRQVREQGTGNREQ
ncbi:metal-dependent hydrolase [Cyanobacterium sp. Dongsha4]|uniref:metal-dependent hydrolase n=1 Tax=Cyanobacterium sp. DS4 TaxID=2878255 RepID=UPI002E811DF4|nr:metal-dependent hydrolase [Cyanobacterium sp. Dongsha4]WVL00450.1 metal-dependent hydrolase [Cyanobacterium sp. Dongsha4]